VPTRDLVKLTVYTLMPLIKYGQRLKDIIDSLGGQVRLFFESRS
jgi:hypothetical protein